MIVLRSSLALALALAISACGGAPTERTARPLVVVEAVTVPSEAVARAGDLEAAAASALSAARASGWRLTWAGPLALRLAAPGAPLTIVGVAEPSEGDGYEPDPDGAPALGAPEGEGRRKRFALQEPDPDGEPAAPNVEEPDPDGEPAAPGKSTACEPDPDGEPAAPACIQARVRVVITARGGAWRAVYTPEVEDVAVAAKAELGL